MKVLFDYQIFISQKIGGISRYHYELLKYLPLFGIRSDLSLYYSNNYYIRNKDVSSHKFFFPHFNLKIRNQFIEKRNNEFTLNKIEKGDYDIFHPTYYDDYFIKKNRKPLVVTIHDMTLEKFIPNDSFIQNKHRIIERADAIIAISHKTKEDIVEMLGIKPEKIEVIYHGNNIIPCSKDHRPNWIINGPYILFVGSRSGYKNFEIVAKAFSKLSTKYKDLMLICVGLPFSEKEKKQFRELNIEKKILCSLVSDEELSYLYSHALFFIFPSLYEGFGMPILEAFACECPVLLSDASCFPEIAQNAGLYFKPTSINDLIDSMEVLLTDSDLRKTLIGNGVERLESFSWEKTACETAMLYKKIL